jgi:hypothetical protein
VVSGANYRAKREKTRPPVWAAPLAGDQAGRLGVSRALDVGIGCGQCKARRPKSLSQHINPVR